MADSLLDRLCAALDETERIAGRAAGHHPEWVYDRHTLAVSTAENPRHSVAARKADGWGLFDVDGEHIARHDPASVLRMVAAHRKILDAYEAAENPTPHEMTSRDDGRYEGLYFAVRALAEAYGIEP